jgi:hypothetical protein
VLSIVFCVNLASSQFVVVPIIPSHKALWSDAIQQLSKSFLRGKMITMLPLPGRCHSSPSPPINSSVSYSTQITPFEVVFRHPVPLRTWSLPNESYDHVKDNDAPDAHLSADSDINCVE